MITLNIYFKCNLLNKGKTCLGGRMCWTPFKSLQHHKKKEIFRVHCSALTDRKIVEISAIFILFGRFFPLYWRFIAWSWYISDFFGNFCRNFSPPIFLQKISCRPLPIHDILAIYPNIFLLTRELSPCSILSPILRFSINISAILPIFRWFFTRSIINGRFHFGHHR